LARSKAAAASRDADKRLSVPVRERLESCHTYERDAKLEFESMARALREGPERAGEK
jgi:hypothetical protein